MANIQPSTAKQFRIVKGKLCHAYATYKTEERATEAFYDMINEGEVSPGIEFVARNGNRWSVFQPAE